jgi:hypothetical protein
MNSNSIIQKNDMLAQIYGETYIKKITYLQRAINEYTTSEDRFNVLNFEAGLGKSYYTDLIIEDHIRSNWFSRKKYLIVKKFNDESEKSAETIESGWVKDVTVAITAESWKEWKLKLDDLKQLKVIIISHQRYIDLCLDDEIRQVFTEGRHTLIVDEKILFPIYSYNDDLHSTVRSILPVSLRKMYDGVCDRLDKELSKIKENDNINACIRVKPKIAEKKLEKFLSLIEVNLENYTIVGDENRSKVRYFVEGLKLWYSSYCVANAGNISTFNPKHKHWGLQNNIILDASASIDGVYQVNQERYNVIKQTRIIDHSDCEFIHINFNSAKWKINENSNKYFNEMTRRIFQANSEGERTLIVTHKDKAELVKKKLIKLAGVQNVWLDRVDKVNDMDYDGQPFAVAWYGNLIGKNHYEEFNNVWFISTPNIPLEQYLIHYMQYAHKTLGNKGIDVFKGRFKNDDFKSVQVGYIAAEMYQSLKRIQRVPKPKGKFYIVNRDLEVVNMVLNQIKGASITKIVDELDFVKKQKEEKEKEKKRDQVEQFRDYVKKLEKGKYAKQDISKTLKISKLSRILEDSRVRELLPTHAGIIRLHKHHIERL